MFLLATVCPSLSPNFIFILKKAVTVPFGVKGQNLVNDIGSRPHDSGHYTIEACETSQYENHLRTILPLLIGLIVLKVPSAEMSMATGRPSVTLGVVCFIFLVSFCGKINDCMLPAEHRLFKVRLWLATRATWSKANLNGEQFVITFTRNPNIIEAKSKYYF
jgi:hypothetical protein